MTDRHRPAKDMIRLIQLLSAHRAYGLTVDEIALRMEMNRRTVQRYLSSLEDIEPDLASRVDEDTQKKYWFLPARRTRAPQVSAEHLASLSEVAAFMLQQGHGSHARILEDIRAALQASLEESTRRRLEPDLEVLDASLEAALRPGPRATFDLGLRNHLLQAILSERKVGFRYRDVPGRKLTERTVSPLVLVAGPRSYLLARDESKGAVRSFALSGITDLVLREEAANRHGFDAAAYVGRSFGAFHDGVFRRWSLRFRPEAAHELEHYQFHPSQVVETMPTGEITVSFECESIREVAYECFRWSEQITAIAPAELQDMLRGIMDNMEKALQAA